MTGVVGTPAHPPVPGGQASSNEIRRRPVPDERAAYDGSAPASAMKPASQNASMQDGQPVSRPSAMIHRIPTLEMPADGPMPYSPSNATPSNIELRLQTSLSGQDVSVAKELEFGDYKNTHDTGYQDYNHRSVLSNDGLPMRTSSVKSLTASHRSISPASVASSPGIGPLAEITPLPSPLGSNHGSWVNLPSASLGSSPLSPQHGYFPTGSSPPTKRKHYAGYGQSGQSDQHGGSGDAAVSRNRSYSNRSSSEYLPAAAPFVRMRNIAVSNGHAPPGSNDSGILQREEYVAPQRGLATKRVPGQPPSPPKSHRGANDSSESEGASEVLHRQLAARDKGYEARTIRSNVLQHWLPLRQLGVGTFSTVMLASSDPNATTKPEADLDPKTLVAVKICEHGPAGGADEKKIESSLKRELEILKSIHHPSLVHLRAVNVLEKRAFLVLDYSAGGDLFEFASLKQELLVPSLIRRMFAELSDAVSYLHANFIVHRDIKLENVLVNPSIDALSKLDYATCPTPIITLTDLGLGRIIPRPPESPLLSTRCGSEDYAAPEVLMGQEYDGRNTDAWALGVLLYALMEGRLPFDPIPGAKRPSPTPHRIARCEWRWMRWGDADGDWDGGVARAAGAANKEQHLQRGSELEEARVVVEGLLKRVSRRWAMSQVQESAWVKEGVRVEGGICRATAEED